MIASRTSKWKPSLVAYEMAGVGLVARAAEDDAWTLFDLPDADKGDTGITVETEDATVRCGWWYWADPEGPVYSWYQGQCFLDGAAVASSGYPVLGFWRYCAEHLGNCDLVCDTHGLAVLSSGILSYCCVWSQHPQTAHSGVYELPLYLPLSIHPDGSQAVYAWYWAEASVLVEEVAVGEGWAIQGTLIVTDHPYPAFGAGQWERTLVTYAATISDSCQDTDFPYTRSISFMQSGAVAADAQSYVVGKFFAPDGTAVTWTLELRDYLGSWSRSGGLTAESTALGALTVDYSFVSESSQGGRVVLTDGVIEIPVSSFGLDITSTTEYGTVAGVVHGTCATEIVETDDNLLGVWIAGGCASRGHHWQQSIGTTTVSDAGWTGAVYAAPWCGSWSGDATGDATTRYRITRQDFKADRIAGGDVLAWSGPVVVAQDDTSVAPVDVVFWAFAPEPEGTMVEHFRGAVDVVAIAPGPRNALGAESPWLACNRLGVIATVYDASSPGNRSYVRTYSGEGVDPSVYVPDLGGDNPYCGAV